MLKNITVLAFSILFYAWGAPKFLFAVIFAVSATFYLVKWMELSKGKRKKQILLSASIFSNLGFLLYFKYANFFIENFNEVLTSFGAENIEWTRVALPIGISFFTFQSLTYGIDVYRGVHKPLKRLTDYMLYIMMFPQMIAGPIVRFNTIADQITNRSSDWDDKLMGIFRFSIGLGKKVLIANVMGETADAIFATDYASLSSSTAWIGILAYSFQIYFDFSGYSDMAIGIGRIIGFKFPENFNNPYVSRSITEFWRRWHITLGEWMKDYLYIPLGGNRVKSKMRLYSNFWIVFLISGLWHGASWNFVLWGGFHGLFLILDRIFLQKLLDKIGAIPATIFTFFIVVMGWVAFRIENFSDAMLYYKRLFAFDFSDITELKMNFWAILLIAIIFSFFTSVKYGLKIHNMVFYSQYSSTRKTIMFIICLSLFLLSLITIISTGFNPFIYFRF